MWSIEFDPSTRILKLRLCDQVTAPQMRQLARAHAQALVCTGGVSFKVFADLRGLAPLDAEAASVFAEIRRAEIGLAELCARTVLVNSPTVAMQQRRTMLEEGRSPRPERITMDEAEAQKFLAEH
jgi:hypothetical protein